MKRIIVAGIVTTAVIACSSPKLAMADQGLSDAASPKGSITNEVRAFTHFVGASHVANGISLRGRTSGTIHLRGIPNGSTVLKAYLYWNFSDTNAIGGATARATLNGNLLNGAKRANNVDPCWGLSGNYTYRADVTSFVPRTTPNQDYEVVLAFSSTTATSGANPWLSSPETRKLEGATLIVVFRHPTTSGRAVAIYDALNGTMFISSLNVTLVHPISLSGEGLYTMSGADGQRGSGHDNAASNKTGFFNGTQISGPPVAASDWDGAAGIPLPQLWDVHTHIADYSGGSSEVTYTSGSDCLVPVVFVLEADTP